jgi:cytochrome c biogenesis protein CcmG/thiol:disulfide interchange protein DsbE
MPCHRALLALAFTLVLPFMGPSDASARRPSHPSHPKVAPAFQLPTRDGAVSSDSLRGRVVVVDFWASWCGPCRGSFPWLRSLHERFGDKGLTVVAINLDKQREDADAFLSQYPAPFIVAFDPAGKTPEAYHVSAMPTTFVIGRDGTILEAHAGFDPKKTAPLENLIQEACAK